MMTFPNPDPAQQTVRPQNTEYIVVEQWETEAMLRCTNAQLHLSWGSPEVRLYREGTTPWIWDTVIQSRADRQKERSEPKH